MNHYIRIAPHIEDAIRNNRPIVALESAIVTHGMPHPDNIELCEQLIEMCNAAQVAPAPIVLLNGQIVVGATVAELQQATEHNPIKVGMREIAPAIAQQKSGGTTVSATAKIAELCGIKVFVTGGIGGVHRGAQQSMDISADLPALASTRMAVVSAGIKAILDIPLTLEYLETHSVPIIGYRCATLPLFFSQSSNYAVTCSTQSIDEVADIIESAWKLGTAHGILIANPCPAQYALSNTEMEQYIAQALNNLQTSEGSSPHPVTGQDVTPLLLDTICTLSGGNSLIANKALVKDNCAVGIALSQTLSDRNFVEQSVT